MIEEMLAYNREFVRSKGYEKFQTSKFPDKKIAILTCMDTRLVATFLAVLELCKARVLHLAGSETDCIVRQERDDVPENLTF